MQQNEFTVSHVTLGMEAARKNAKKLSPNCQEDLSYQHRHKSGEDYWIWLERALINMRLLDGANTELNKRVMQFLQKEHQDPKFAPKYLADDVVKTLQNLRLTPSNTIARPSVVFQTIQEAIYYHQGDDIPMGTNLASAYEPGGSGYPVKKGAQEETYVRDSTSRLGMSGLYSNKPNPNFNKIKNITFSDFLNLGLYQMGGSYRTEHCTLLRYGPKQLLGDIKKKFHQVVVAARNLRGRKKGGDNYDYYNHQNKFFSENPDIYIQEMALFAHYQYQHTLESGSKTLYAGALGCGIFENPSHMVALIHMAALQYQEYEGLNVSFAIYDKSRQLNKSFHRVFKYYEQLAKTEVGKKIIAIAQGDSHVDLGNKELLDLEKALKDELVELEKKEMLVGENTLTKIQEIRDSLQDYFPDGKPRVTITKAYEAPHNQPVIDRGRLMLVFPNKQAFDQFALLAKVCDMKVESSEDKFVWPTDVDGFIKKLRNKVECDSKVKSHLTTMLGTHRELAETDVGQKMKALIQGDAKSLSVTSDLLALLPELNQTILQIEQGKRKNNFGIIEKYISSCFPGIQPHCDIRDDQIILYFKNLRCMSAFKNLAKIWGVKYREGCLMVSFASRQDETLFANHLQNTQQRLHSLITLHMQLCVLAADPDAEVQPIELVNDDGADKKCLQLLCTEQFAKTLKVYLLSQNIREGEISCVQNNKGKQWKVSFVGVESIAKVLPHFGCTSPANISRFLGQHKFTISHRLPNVDKIRAKHHKLDESCTEDPTYNNHAGIATKPGYWVWLRDFLSKKGKPLYGATDKRKNEIIDRLKAVCKDPKKKPTFLSSQEVTNIEQLKLKPSTAIHRPAVVFQTIQEAIYHYKEKGIPMATNLANAKNPCGAGYPLEGAQEEGMALYSDMRFLMFAIYMSISNYALYPTFQDFMNLGLYQLGGSYRTENNTLLMYLSEQLLGECEKPFHQVVVAARDFRRGNGFFQDNPQLYIQEMALFSHYQYQHTLASGATTLYAGALGCGVFRNPCHIVALVHMAALQYQKYDKLNVSFAIFDKSHRLNEAFHLIFKHYEALAKTKVGKNIIAIAQGHAGVDLSNQKLWDLEKELKIELQKLESKPGKKIEIHRQEIEKQLANSLLSSELKLTIANKKFPRNKPVVEGAQRIMLEFKSFQGLREFELIAQACKIKIEKNWLKVFLPSDAGEFVKQLQDQGADNKIKSFVIQHMKMNLKSYKALSDTAIAKKINQVQPSISTKALWLLLHELEQEVAQLENKTRKNNRKVIEKNIPNYLPEIKPICQVEGQHISLEFTSMENVQTFKNLAKVWGVESKSSDLIVRLSFNSATLLANNLKIMNQRLHQWITLNMQLCVLKMNPKAKVHPPIIELVKEPDFDEISLHLNCSEEFAKALQSYLKSVKFNDARILHKDKQYRVSFEGLELITKVLPLFGCSSPQVIIRFFEVQDVEVDMVLCTQLACDNLREDGDSKWIASHLKEIENMSDRVSALLHISSLLETMKNNPQRYSKNSTGSFYKSLKDLHRASIVNTFQNIAAKVYNSKKAPSQGDINNVNSISQLYGIDLDTGTCCTM